ncbi:MAG: hypothetical protein PHV59_12055 [Victivallales bacterium]|nr:hypothetical protein [Victivallales bacterium]
MLFPAPKAKAIDPVTIAILAPIALKAAEISYPYVVRGLANFGKGLLLCGKDLINVCRLPLGFIQTTFGLPFGGLSSGVRNLVLGAIAPFQLGFHAAMLPLNIFGIGV